MVLLIRVALDLTSCTNRYLEPASSHNSTKIRKMSYIHIPHDRPLEHRTAFQILKTHAKQHPSKEALVFRNEKLNRVSITFQEYDTRSSYLAAGLLEIGVGRGDRVLVLLPPCVEFVLFHMALNRIGAVTIAPEEDSYLMRLSNSVLSALKLHDNYKTHESLGRL
ncbi:Acetyl-coenzyme A synthetase [Exaiptasia diaphana]|nr:Acetyl-coenzyme A synthetase [Exaiptasia diaphana]